MNKQFSIYLDLLRFLAAVLVFCVHVPSFAGGWLWQFSRFGHEAVVFFFVLSGFVIAYVCIEKKESFSVYAVNRLTRIYSVAIPALILTIICFYLTIIINPEVFEHIKLRGFVVTTASAITFLNQSWVATPVFSNLPYWSLGYEVLYYLFFACLFYMRNFKGAVLALLVSILMGPSILLYLPIWMLGVVCFIVVQRYPLSLVLGRLLWFLSVFGILIILNTLSLKDYFNFVGKEYLGSFFYSLLLDPAHKFVTDYVLAIFVALHIISSASLGNKINIFNTLYEKIIRGASKHTFSLYLYHMPLLFLVSTIFPYEKYTVLTFVACWVVVPLFIYYLSDYTEGKKDHYKYFFKSIFNRFDKAQSSQQ